MTDYQMDLKSFNIRPYRSKALREYARRMSVDNDHVVFDDNVADVLKAQGFYPGDTPRSIYRVEKLYEALSKYAPIYAHGLNQDEHVRHGIALARTCFAKPHDVPPLEMLPMTLFSIMGLTSNPGGSAGLTAYGRTKAECYTRALERGLETLRGDKAPEPCLAFSRTQFNEKTRLVWGYPYSMTAIEGLIAYPLLRFLKSYNTPMAFAMTTGVLGTKLRVASYHRRWAYSLDFSRFDATISSQLIKIAFNILRTWFDLDQVERATGLTVGHVFDLVERYFINTPIVMPDMNLYLGKRHGVPSGSYFTQLIDSIVNVIVGGAAASRFAMHVSRKEIFVLGDDLLMWSNRSISLDLIAEYISAQFGMVVGGDGKSQVFHFSEPVHYLGRDWPNGLPTLDTDGIIARMSYPERFRKYSDDPEKRRREVKLLLLSYAAVYMDAWPIVQRTLGSDLWRSQGAETIEGQVYDVPNTMINVDHLSGLQRFQAKYGQTVGTSGLTTVATQYWL